MQCRPPVAARQIGKPLPVFQRGVFADALEIAEHGEAQRIRVDTAVARVTHRQLADHVGVRAQELDHETVGQAALVVQGVEQGVVPERGPSFVHHLGLALRVKVLRHLAHDAHHLALPGFQQRRVFFDEIEQVFLGLGRETPAGFFHLLVRSLGQGAPEVVDLLLQIGLAVLAPHLFLRQRGLLRTPVAVHALAHERVARIQQRLHRFDAMQLLALRDIVSGIDQVVDDGLGVGPHAEQVVALEERVVAVAGVRDHQRLHGHGVLFHQVGDAGIGVDHDLVGQPHLTAPVVFLGRDELLAEGPVAVVDRHAHRGVGIDHLFGGDDLQLHRVGVQSEVARHARNLRVVGLDEFKSPVRGTGQGLPVPARGSRIAANLGHRFPRDIVGVHHEVPAFLNSSRNTG
ncbi:hypothetical protein Y695_02465 [Hydrogenophaga sp. T4]|nr:hypothetical protein Y695_02465 [Hydrogenophaga sp. T4]